MPNSPASLRPYAALHRAAGQFIRTKDVDPGQAHAALRRALSAYVEGGWGALDTVRDAELDQLDPVGRTVIATAVRGVSDSLRAIWPDTDDDHDRLGRFVPRVGEIAVLAGERIVAMRMAGQADARTDYMATLLTEQILGAHYAGRIRQLSLLRGIPVPDLAPAAFAALIAHDQTQKRETILDAATALDKFDLADGARLSASDLRGLAHVLNQALTQGETHITDVVKSYDAVSRSAFKGEPVQPDTNSERLYNKVTGHRPTKDPTARVSTLVAFASSARGGSDQARIDGALDLFRSIVSVARIRGARKGSAPTRYALLGSGVRGLRDLEPVVRNERFAHGMVEKRWQEVEKELQYHKQRNPKESPVLPLPSDMSALEVMALYVQSLAARGVPLGKIVADLSDSETLTFGRTERRFFLRVATYAARKYAANLASHENPRVDEIIDQAARGEETRQVLADLEIELRKRERQSDQELLLLGKNLLEEHVRSGELRAREAEAALPILDAMVTRLRAGQEVRYLTALMAVEGEIPDDVIYSYSGLPHTRRFALLSAPEARIHQQYARNGQPFREFEKDALGRWLRYRQQAPAGRDVVDVHLEYDEARSGLGRSDEGRQLFRKSLKDFAPDVDLAHAGQSTPRAQSVSPHNQRGDSTNRGRQQRTRHG